MQKDEHELIALVLNGNIAAFRDLMHEYEQLVYVLVNRIIQKPDDEKDICQEVFIKVYGNLKNFRHEAKLSTWISRIAYTTALNHLQSQKNNKKAVVDLNKLEEAFLDEEEPSTIFLQKDKAAYIRKQIDRLPLAYRTVITLYHLQELSYKEIESITGMPEGTVKNYLFRARKLLKDKLKKVHD